MKSVKNITSLLLFFLFSFYNSAFSIEVKDCDYKPFAVDTLENETYYHKELAKCFRNQLDALVRLSDNSQGKLESETLGHLSSWLLCPGKNAFTRKGHIFYYYYTLTNHSKAYDANLSDPTGWLQRLIKSLYSQEKSVELKLDITPKKAAINYDEIQVITIDDPKPVSGWRKWCCFRKCYKTEVRKINSNVS